MVVNGRSLLVSVIIVTHNWKDKLCRLLQSVFKSEYQPIEVVVVDDCSSDGTENMIRLDFPKVRFVRNNRELELSACRNIGAKVSNGLYLFFVDDDNVVDKEAVSILVDTFERTNDFGVLGPLAYYYCKPTLVWGAGTRRGRFTQFSRFIGHNELKNKEEFSYNECDDFSNAFMVKRNAFVAIHGFDAYGFPSHLGEADFCRRIKLYGFGKVVLDPRAVVWHDIPIMAANQAFSRYLPRPVVAYEWERNRIILQRKYGSLIDFVSFIVLFEPLYVGVFLVLTSSVNCSFAKKFKVISRMLRGIRDALVSGDKISERFF
jgi:GT2 family glycosyltransferase